MYGYVYVYVNEYVNEYVYVYVYVNGYVYGIKSAHAIPNSSFLIPHSQRSWFLPISFRF